MDSLDDPQAYQTSMVVQKSSKSGIFTNKRLLVIKNGFLYYFSDVPKNYKSHVPNILSTFKDLPKSSIQIKNIQDIRLQSAKSSSLIIKFYEKDMIDKQDLRKSINTKSYSAPQKKDTKDTQQWKFTFPTVLLCRMWLNALMKLKQYFKKQQDHFKSFISNFNSNQKKEGQSNQKQGRSNSEIKPLSSTVVNINSVDSNNNPRKTQPLKQSLQIQFLASQKQDSQTTKKKEQEPQKIQSKQQKKLQKVSSIIKIQQKQLKKVESVEKLNQQKELIGYIDKNISTKESQKIEMKQSIVTQIKKGPVAVVIQKKQLDLYKNDQLGIINQEDQLRVKNIQEQIRNQIQEQIRKQEKKKKQKQFREYQRMLQEKQRKIQNLQTEIRLSKVLAQQKQREIQEQKASLIKKIKLQQQKNLQEKKQISVFQQSQKKFIQQHNFTLSDEQSYSPTQKKTSKSKYKQTSNQPQITKCEVNQFSVQTDQEEFYNQNQVQESSQINNAMLEKVRNSFFSDFSSTYRQTLNLLRTSENLTFTQKFENYDFFKVQSTLFLKNQTKTSDQRLKKQIEFLCYIRYTREKAQKIIRQYIQENLPSQNKAFEKDEFFIEIVCSPGKVVNIQGEDKLVYSNKTHQSLKREFKIYQKLQNKILKSIKKKDNFPLRVPLCVLVQYRGYTVLAKILPKTLSSSQIKDYSSQSQLSVIGKKHMKQLIQSHFINCFQYNQIESIGFQKTDFMILVKINTLFKVTDVQTNTNLFASNKEKGLNTIQNIAILINQCRAKSISISHQKLLEDFNISTSNQQQPQSQNNRTNKAQLKKRLNYIKICRQLKKILKSTQPYSGSSKQSSFFKAFLQNPIQISKLIPSNIDQNIFKNINGQLFYYLQLFLGLRLNKKYNQQILDDLNLNQLKIQCIPLTRSFQLESLISYQHAHRFHKYFQQEKLQSLQNSYKILISIESDETIRNIAEAKLLLKNKMAQIAIQKLLQAKRKIGFHDLRKFQLYLLMIQAYISLGKESDVLKELKQVLLFVEYMYGQDCTFKLNIYLLMAEALVRMGNLVEAMKMYHLIFKSSQTNKFNQVLDKSLIYLSFSKVLHHNYNADSNQLINFITEFVQKLNSKDITIKIQTSIHLAQLYQSIGKWDKAKQHYQEALLILIENAFFDNRFKIVYSNLLNLYQDDETKENILNQILLANNEISGRNKLIQQSQNQQKLDFMLNTINLLHIIQNLDEKDKILINNLMTKIGPNLQKAALQKQVKSIITRRESTKKQQILSFLDMKRYIHELIFTAQQINQNKVEHKQNQVGKSDIDNINNILYNNIKEKNPILQNNKIAIILKEYASELLIENKQK